MYQRGSVGAPVILSVIGGLVVFYIGYSFLGSLTRQDVADVAAPSNPVSAESGSQQPRTQSYVSFDNNLFQSGGDFFVRIPLGLDEDGNQKYSYIKANIADAKTFRKVPVLGGTEAGVGKKGANQGGTMPSFYMDSQHVYFFSGTSIEILAGADPNSFQVLNSVYAKDNNNVYVVNTTCDVEGNCTGTVTVIPGAQPDTFQAIHETTVPDPDGTGTVVIDAKDDENIYYYGIWVGPLPDPDDHSLHPEVDNPVLISP